MCGIAGIWDDGGVERLKPMADALCHRGPDGEGYWTNPQAGIGLVHRRLTVIDPAGGKQPMFNEDGRVVTVFNGVIYNYRELRDDLIARGHRFATQSDTEVIVHLYEDYGTDLASRLRGMFGIAVWDDRERQLILIRDRVGKKPLYYGGNGDWFLFGSEIKALVAVLKAGARAGCRGSEGGPGLTLDGQAIADYLAWGSVPAPGTIYQPIRAMLPGQILVVRNRRIVEKRRYWRQRMHPKSPVSVPAAVEQVDALLQEAVRLRLRSDVPIAAFLSGGIDSGIITAMASQQYGSRLTTITIGFEDQAFDERPLARLVAQRYGTEHHEIVVHPRVAEDLPSIVNAYDQPFADSSCIPSFYIARAARQLTKVVLNGDGGDELFAGYRRYLAARLNALFHWADGPLARPVWHALAHLLPVPRGFRTGYAFAHRWIRGMALTPAARYLAWSVDGIPGDELAALLLRGECPARGFDFPSAEVAAYPDGAKFRKRRRRLQSHHGGSPVATSEFALLTSPDLVPADRVAAAVLADHHRCGLVDQMLATDFATILPNDLLVKMDIATMAHGLEARSPMLDHALVDTVSSYPEFTKLSGVRTKPILRELAARYLPPEVCQAPKRGFEVPLVRWLQGELRELSNDVILSRDGLLAQIFERPALERLLRGEHFADRPAARVFAGRNRRARRVEPARWSRQVWLLLMLGMWDREVFKRSYPASAALPSARVTTGTASPAAVNPQSAFGNGR